MNLIRDLWYKLICRFWHRYNVIICRSIPPTWIDRDELLLCAAFQILEDFVRKERGHFFEDVYALYVEPGGTSASTSTVLTKRTPCDFTN
jgi:hypothetical protein